MGAIADLDAKHSLYARAKVAPTGVRRCKDVSHDTQRRYVGEDALARRHGARQWPHLFAAHPLLRLIWLFAILHCVAGMSNERAVVPGAVEIGAHEPVPLEPAQFNARAHSAF